MFITVCSQFINLFRKLNLFCQKITRQHKIAYITFILFLGTVSTTNAEIIDPNNILSQVDSFLGRIPFEDSFKLNDSVDISFSECINKFSCQSHGISKAVIESENNHLFINIYDSTNKKNSTEGITQNFWESINRNFFRAKLNKIESFGFKISILDSNLIDCSANQLLNFDNQCLQVRLRAINSVKQESEYTFLLIKSTIGLSQILGYTQIDFISESLQRTIKYTISNVKRVK